MVRQKGIYKKYQLDKFEWYATIENGKSLDKLQMFLHQNYPDVMFDAICKGLKLEEVIIQLLEQNGETRL